MQPNLAQVNDMKLFLLVAVTMAAFAGNSVLNRFGVGMLGMDPMHFAVIRTVAGAGVLTALVLMRGGRVPINTRRMAGAFALAAYMVGFSWAYLSLDAGLGALILFGVLQVAMFGFAVFRGQNIPSLRWIGAGLAMVGLIVLLWPSGATAVPIWGAVAMIVAGVAWAAYTLLGQGEGDAIAASAGNFVLAVPLVGLSLLLADGGTLTASGVLVAAVAGAVTSGLGYALWYSCLPKLPTTTAAISQLSVPIIAVAGGVIFLSEPLTMRLVAAGVLVLGGIGVSLIRR